MLGGLAYPLGHEKQLTAYLLNNILGGGALNSRLNLSLREQRGLVYTVESTYTPLSDNGYWCVYFACDKEDKETCIRLAQCELRKLCEQPLTDKQLEAAKQQIHGQMAIAAENRENAALTMAKQVLYFGQAETWQQTFAHIEQITATQLQEVAKELYNEDKMVLLEYN